MVFKNQLKNQTLSYIAIVALTLLTVGCSSSEKKHHAHGASVESGASKQSPASASGPGSIMAHGTEAFMLSDKLTQEQKEKLMKIHTRTFQEAGQLRGDLSKAKVELFKTIAQGKYKTSDIERLKKRIIEIDQKRLQIMFKTLEEVEAIIGHGVDAEEIYRRFYDFDRPRHMDVGTM